jgi:hypothetical protein
MNSSATSNQSSAVTQLPLRLLWCSSLFRALLASSLLAILFTSALGARAQSTVGEVFASDASVHGSVILAAGGTRVLSGSTVAAGAGAATLKLERGGEVRICPGTNLSVSASSSGRELALGFSTGAVELHYPLASSADSLQTPDFRLLLAGPGAFHLAVSGDARGNACVRTLPSNTASVIVSELMGDGTYQVKADEQVVFRRGHIADVSQDLPPDCGCPAAAPAVNRAANEAPSIEPTTSAIPSASAPDEADVAPALATSSADVAAVTATQPAAWPDAASANTPPTAAASQVATVAAAPDAATAPTPPARPNQLHVEVEAPFVFRGDDPGPPPPSIAQVRLSDRAAQLVFDPVVHPPVVHPPVADAAVTSSPVEAAVSAAKPVPRKAFFGRLRSFFAALFK